MGYLLFSSFSFFAEILSIPFMGYEFSSSYVTYQGYVIFQFPLWDTKSAASSNKESASPFNSLYGIHEYNYN